MQPRTHLNPHNSLATILFATALFSSAGAQAQVEYVTPSIGNVGQLLEPTRPTVSLPNSMVRVYPVRQDGLDDQIQSFPLIIISHRLGELFWLMPCDGEPDAGAWHRPAAYDQARETPYYYSVRLDGSFIRIEFTPTARCGYFRFTFPSGKPVVLLANRQGGELTVEGTNAISGVERFNDMRAFVYGQFSAPVNLVPGDNGGKSRLAALAPDQGNILEFRYGISFISLDQARRNLRHEIPAWDFESVKSHARDRWNQALGQVQVEGGTPAQRRVFYTALYRCYERMVNITEDGQYYSSFDHKVHQDTRPFYVDNWLWDTYRALEPLQTLLNPEMEADKIQSYVRMYEQSSWMPSFAVLWGDYACMTGNHAAAWMADAWFKGVTHYDLKTAYEGVRKNSLEATLLPWRNGPKTSLDDFYNEHGYLPALHPGENESVPEVNPGERRQAVSVTLEQSYDDWCTAQMARALDKDADYQLFLKRAAYYKNVYRQDKGFMWPKDAKGNWIEPFDPRFSGGQGGRDYTTENTDYTYNWDVQHDFDGLAHLMGGYKAAETKLDQLFRADLGRSKYEFFAVFPDSTGLVGQFSMGNEPSLVIPYVYNHLGVPWKAQKRLRQLLEYWFTDTALGIPGDEDGGGMSAFVVFSMMGFYPTVPSVPMYELGSPVFARVTVRLHNGKTLRVVCKNNSADNKYVKNFRLNGQLQNKVWFRHADVVKGATLDLEMADTPNPALGADPASFPPSSLNLDPRKLQ
ncbi:MAG TPA: GH92 family glycosyl hydrolase [Candidatus Acidoferrum sp.]|jgi:predicted alpha-1,2-mannosidase|nr:GH92 family glycosyl hydrolase [Candidatus Acidoferrum sp.]